MTREDVKKLAMISAEKAVKKMKITKENGHNVYHVKGDKYRVAQISLAVLVIEKEVPRFVLGSINGDRLLKTKGWDRLGEKFKSVGGCLAYFEELEKYPIYH